VRLTKHLWYMSYNFDQLSVSTAGATPFWRAAYGTDLDAMKLLLKYGADPSVATIKPVALLGGDRAAREPWRNLYAHLMAELGWAEVAMNFGELPVIERLAGFAPFVEDRAAIEVNGRGHVARLGRFANRAA
jgi:hypothetical protein